MCVEENRGINEPRWGIGVDELERGRTEESAMGRETLNKANGLSFSICC